MTLDDAIKQQEAAILKSFGIPASIVGGSELTSSFLAAEAEAALFAQKIDRMMQSLSEDVERRLIWNLLLNDRDHSLDYFEAVTRSRCGRPDPSPSGHQIETSNGADRN